MSSNALRSLLTEEFVESLGLCGTAAGLRRGLQRSKYVKAVRESIASGELTEKTLRGFIRDLMRSWKPGVQFPYDFALAALAVALEKRFTPFVDEYLLDLARLGGIAELDLSPKVAQAVRRDWGVQRGLLVERRRPFLKGAFTFEQVPDFWLTRSPVPRSSKANSAKVLSVNLRNA